MTRRIESQQVNTVGSKGSLLAYMLVAVFSFLPYLNVLHGEFVIDDVAFYVDNPAFTADTNIGRFFRTSVWEHSTLRVKDAPLYRPFFLTVMWINQTLFGGNIVAHHLFSISLHAAASLLLLQLLRRLLPEAGLLPALAGALIFAVHPVHVEAVSWISAYGHVMATALLLGAMLCYLRHLEGAWYWFGLSLALFALALLTLEAAVAFPLMITAYEYLRLRRIRLLRVAPFWAVLALYFVVRKLILREMIPLEIGNLSAWGTTLSFATAYIEHLFVPWPQFFYLAMPEGGIVTPGGGVLALLLAAIVIVAMRMSLEKKAVLLFGLSWIVFALAVPVLAAFNLRPLFAMRSMYLPSVGLGILIAWIVAIPLRRHRSIAWAAIALLIMAAVPSAMMANRDWLVNVEVYEKMLLVTPKAAGPAIALAEIYGSRGAAENEERTLLRAAEYAQDDQSRIDVYDHLGLMYGIRGDVTKSEHYYRKVLELAPKRSSAWVGLGNNAWARGNMRSALDAYLTAVEADPANYEANNNVALAYRQLGDLSRAAEYSQRARGMQQTTVGH